MHEIDENIISIEKALSHEEWPYLEKRYQQTFCFYLMNIGGKIYYREPKEKPKRLLKCSTRQKDLASFRLMDFFRKLIKKKG